MKQIIRRYPLPLRKKVAILFLSKAKTVRKIRDDFKTGIIDIICLPALIAVYPIASVADLVIWTNNTLKGGR